MRSIGARTGRGLLFLALLCATTAAVAAPPQSDDFDDDVPASRPVVQALPPKGADELNSALLRLARNAEDVNALLDAGHASLKLGDVDAAIGFFSRADRLSRGNARAKAGLAAAFVRSENPYDALLMFDEAERAGAQVQSLAADRGLAHDLVGDNARAQELYRTALSQNSDPEITRRLALSLAVTGDKAASETALRPLLERRDLAAYRTRAFALAILGDVKAAQEIASVRLPGQLSARIGPYLRYMPRLTPAQQVAAATFGHFPKTADIGRDDPRVARVAGATPRAPGRRADSALIPSGEPLGRKTGGTKVARADAASARPGRGRARTPQAAAAPVQTRAPSAPAVRTDPAAKPGFSIAQAPAAPAQQPAIAPARPAAATPAQPAPTGPVVQQVPSASAPQAAAASAQPAPPVSQAAAAAVVGPPAPAPAASPVVQQAPQAVPLPQSAAAPTPTVPAPQASMPAPPATTAVGPPAPAPAVVAAPTPAATPPVPTPAPAAPDPQPAAASPPQAQPEEPAPKSVAEAFADFMLASSDPAQPGSGAVDISKITPPRESLPTSQSAGDAAKADQAQAEKAAAQKAKADTAKQAKLEPPKQPSRVWVQVATGRDRDALSFDWRRFSRSEASLFKGRSAFIAKWGQTNRLVTGPFANGKEAAAFVSDLKKAGMDAFVFTSKEGEAVDPL